MRIFPFKSSSPSPTFSSTQTHPSCPMRDTATESIMVEKVENARTLISKWFTLSSPNTSLHANNTYLFREYRSEAKQYLSSVMGLQEAMQYFATNKSATDKLLHAHKLMETAMHRLQNEFHQVLSSHQRHSFHCRLSKASARSSLSDLSECESEDKVKFAEVSVSRIERSSMDEVEDLKAIADCMLASGYGKECLNIYKSVRKSIVDEGLFHLGLLDCSHTSSKKHKLDWEVLEVKIKSWLYSMRTAIKTLFDGENILLNQVFPASESIRESCFSYITRDGAISLFEFAESVAKCKKSPERLFRILDLYEAIAEAWPEIESIFSYKSTSCVRSQAINALVKLGEAARAMLTNFESAIQKDMSKRPVPGGGVHPLTQYVLNYLTFLTDYGEILADIFGEWPLNIQSPLPESYFTKTHQSDDDDGISSAISTRFAWLILVLLCKLDAKAKLYKDVALSYLFLANNLQYVLVKVRGSKLRYLLGDEWTLKQEEKVKQYTDSYVRIGWSKVFSSLPEDPTAEIDLRGAKDHFEEFNSSFDESCKKQAGWVVPDPKLRDEIRLTLVRQVVKSYAPFYEKYRGRFKSAAMEKIHPIVRFAPEDLDYYLSDLFATGSPGDGSGSVSSSYASTTSSLNASPSPPSRSPARTIGGRAVEVN